MSDSCDCDAEYCPKCGNNYRGSSYCPICDYADKVMNGDYGDGDERRKNLGGWYNGVQNEVNRRTGYSKRY